MKETDKNIKKPSVKKTKILSVVGTTPKNKEKEIEEEKRVTRSGHAIEAPAGKNFTPAKERQDKKEIKSQMKKIRIDDEDEIDLLLD